jgi:acetyltransferase-like isoleucine patch superfamily enzyme
VREPVDLRPHCWIYSDRLTIGAGTFISYGCHIENREDVRIGPGCAIANQATILTSTHQIGPGAGRAGDYAGAPVSIEAGCESRPASPPWAARP